MTPAATAATASPNALPRVQDLTAQSPEQVARVVSTNLIGSLLCSRAALRHMGAQPGGGHIFNTEGAGSDGAPTPQVRERTVRRRVWEL